MRLKTNGKKKLNKARKRVNRVVMQDVRNSIEQQNKWKAKVANQRTPSAGAKAK